MASADLDLLAVESIFERCYIYGVRRQQYMLLRHIELETRYDTRGYIRFVLNVDW